MTVIVQAVKAMEAKNKEIIGNVTLNLDYYSGQDFYSEGEAEDRLLDLVTRYTEADYEHVIQNCKSWSVMYHLSHIRENIVAWLPILPKDKILEIGAGCGAVTGGLAKRGGKVDCIELSKKRSLINATRHKEYNNIDIIVGNYTDIEPNLDCDYDYITLCGVLEYAGSYIDSKEPYVELLRSAAKHLSPTGKLIVAIENKFGLKYFAGCKEDHTGNYFDGIEGYKSNEGVRTFSKAGLLKMIEKLELKAKFYYPYPDYKLPHTIYSDDVLPHEGELNTNLRNYDNDRIVLFDETKAFDSIIEEGNFDYFSNSYVVIITREDIYDCMHKVPLFAKYANERVVDSRVTTILCKDKAQNIMVYKGAGNNASNQHVRKVADNYKRFLKQYENSKFVPNKCELIEGYEPVPLVVGATSKSIDVLDLEYLSGKSMENYIFELAEKEQYIEIESLIRTYINEVTSITGKVPFKQTKRFEDVFGNHTFDESYTGAEGSNYDLIFSNILFDKEKGPNGAWNILDYEWSFDFPVPDKFIAFRGLYYYFEYTNPALKAKYEEYGVNIYEKFGFSADEVDAFIDMEHHFQVYIIGGVASLEVLHAIMPTTTMFLDSILRESNALKNLNSPKIYYSYGEGYSEEHRVYTISKVHGNRVEMDIQIASNMRGIRIDPTDYNSIVTVKDMYFITKTGEAKWVDRYKINGYRISDRTVLFDTDDAQIIIDDFGPGMEKLHVSYDVAMFLPDMYEDFKHLAEENQQKNRRSNALLDKILRKLHIIKGSAPLEGYRYNVGR